MTLSFMPMLALIFFLKNPSFEEQGLEIISDAIASSACFGRNHTCLLHKCLYMVIFDFGSNDILVSPV